MIRSSCLLQARLVPLRSPIALKAASCTTRCVPSRISLFELSSWLARAASTSPNPKPNSTLKAAPGSNAKSLKSIAAPRLVVYHAGTPRIMFLGVLKATTAFVFGFFAMVTVPSYVQIDAPVWQTAGLVVASVIPMLTVWYLTSPMVMWMHVSVPKSCRNNATELERFFKSIPTNTELAITTMGPLGNARISKMPLKDLRHEERRLGLVNYVRDVSRENAERRWYHFRAVGQFKIEDGVVDPKTKAPWPWYLIQKALKGKSGEPAVKRDPSKRNFTLPKVRDDGAANNTKRREARPLDSLKSGSSPSHNEQSKYAVESKRENWKKW